MLSIRMQRTGRKGYPTYRVVVQDSRRTPTSGSYVYVLGNYNPHSKQVNLQKDKSEFYLSHGAQPTDRVVKLFKSEKISLPKWVEPPIKQKRAIRHPDKLRKNRPSDAKALEDKPAEPKAPEPAAEASTETAEAEKTTAEEVKAEEAPADNQAKAKETADLPETEAETRQEKTPEVKSEEVEKDDETKTPPNEDEYPEDKKAAARDEKS